MAETPTEISVEGYADIDIGTYINTNWAFIEFRNGDNTAKVVRISSDPLSEPRVTSATVSADKKYVTYIIALNGDDTDIGTLPQTIGYAQMKKGNTDEEAYMAQDSFTAATMSDPDDVLTITLRAGILPPET